MAHGQLGKVIQFLRRTTAAPKTATVTDRQLLERFAHKREEHAFATLVERHGPMVLAVCRRVLGEVHAADDAFQATFLVLSQKAGAGRWQESVGGWLHEVAFRVAHKARVDVARRRAHERQVPDVSTVNPAADVDLRELRQVLDEELTRLPEKYRAPLVLCYLEGKTNEEAAAQLGWSKGTVSGQLARGRDLLRSRLSRRGLTLPAAACGFAISESATPAAVSAALATATIQAALFGAAAKAAAAGAVAGPVAALAEGVLRTMFLTKLKIAALVLLTVGIVGGGAGFLGYRTVAGDASGTPVALAPLPDEGPRNAKPAQPISAKAAERRKQFMDHIDRFAFSLNYVGPEDKPFYRLRLQVAEPAGDAQPFHQVARLTKAEAETLIDQLAATGFLDRADNLAGVDKEPPPGPTYTLWVTGPPATALYEVLGWDDALCRRLHEMRPALQGDAARKMETLLGRFGFLVASRPVRVNGVDFEVVTDQKWFVPETGKTRPIDISLRITNRTDKDLDILDMLYLRLATTDGKELKFIIEGRDGKRAPVRVRVAAGKGMMIPLWTKAELAWATDGKTLRLNYSDATAGWGHFEGLQADSAYRLAISYEFPQQRDGFWTGKVQTEDVQVRIERLTAHQSISKPVRVSGVDFEMVADKLWKMPGVGEKTPISLALRITNPTDKDLHFNLFDTILPHVQTADSKQQWVGAARRTATQPADPVSVAAGKSVTLARGATLSWSEDGKSLRLFGGDGSGGSWVMDGLKPGKYRVSFTYENKEEKSDFFKNAQPFWVGKAQTEEADVDIDTPLARDTGAADDNALIRVRRMGGFGPKGGQVLFEFTVERNGSFRHDGKTGTLPQQAIADLIEQLAKADPGPGAEDAGPVAVTWKDKDGKSQKKIFQLPRSAPDCQKLLDTIGQLTRKYGREAR